MGLIGFDCLIVGRGIVGLAHALAAARHGLRTAVIDRDLRARGASVRGFGLIAVTGQQAGLSWRRARRTRDIWADVASEAGIPIRQRGLLLVARRRESLAVIEEFAGGPTGAGSRVLRGKALAALTPPLRRRLHGALYSPHELRVESREAVPRLAAWLAATHDVSFLPRAAVHAVATGRADTSAGPVAAQHIVVCPGPDVVTLFPEEHASRDVTLCKLQMMRLAAPGWRLPAAVMSDLSLLHDPGYADCPSLSALRGRIAAEQAPWLADGVHLTAVQGADDSLIVGNSRHYDPCPDPFQASAIDDRVLDELAAVLDLPSPAVVERWTGVYPAIQGPAFTAAPMQGVRLVNGTDGIGTSTAFAVAEETLADLLGLPPPAHVAEAQG